MNDKNLNASVDDNYNITYDSNNILGSEDTWTEPIIFTIPKKNDISIRRTYKMPNIFSYVRLAHYIHLNKDYFSNLFFNNKQSTSKYFNQLQFKEFGVTEKISTKLLSYGNHVLNLDLSNFYPSLYTHSLAWVDLGKQVAKNDHENGIGNNLDKLVRAEQYGETHGVPTGNILTRIVTEYFLCKIDGELEDEGYLYTRYVDDLKYPFNDEKSKDDFLTIVHDKCNEYNIALNEQKTLVEHYPIENKLNKQHIFSFFENYKSNLYTKWINKIYDYINLCIDEEANGNKGSIKTMYKGAFFAVKDLTFVNHIFTHTNPLTGYNVFKHFLDVSLKDSKLANRFLEFSDNLINLGVDHNSLKLLVSEYFRENNKKIRVKIVKCVQNKYNQEVYQLLLYFLVFEVYNNIAQREIMELIGENQDDTGFLLKLLHFDNDDFSITLAITIYLQITINQYLVKSDYNTYNLYMNKLFEKLDNLFKKSYTSYLTQSEISAHPINNPNTSRMKEKFWFVRYYIYYLTKTYKQFKQSRNKYCRDNYIPKSGGSIGYQSQLNWNFVKTNSKIDDFYNMMLEEGIRLFHFDFTNYR